MATVAEFRMWLDALRRHDPSRQLFGAGKHRYEMNPCIGIEELERTEAALGTRLPEEYREFLLTCGNGGAGPDYGILSLAESVGEFGGDPVGIVGNDFVPPVSAAAKQMDRRYPDAGVLPIADIGCGHMWVLVTSGSERGSIWSYLAGGDYEPASRQCPDNSPAISWDEWLRANDRRVDELLANPASRLTFWEWYREWVDRMLLL